MARPELGTKRVCPTTGRKFYDLGRDPIVSPYTGEVLTGLVEPAAVAPPPPRPVRAREPEEDEEAEVVPQGPETVSLEEVGAAEEETAEASEEEGGTDDTFLEEEEEGGDVSDLIDGDIEEDEEH